MGKLWGHHKMGNLKTYPTVIRAFVCNLGLFSSYSFLVFFMSSTVIMYYITRKNTILKIRDWDTEGQILHKVSEMVELIEE